MFGTEGPAVRGRGHAAAGWPARFSSQRRRRLLLDTSWPGRDSEPQQRGCEDEKRSEENPIFYLKSCQECEQTGVKKTLLSAILE
ncbi:Leucine-Rich Repeat Serine/Threonine-Protein Kinase 2 [Manis pentadactyla]|nr:Leucine-Rich Repeat Serine/Threonine-Protein Kinase 2 [Manis pentadactyla]